MWKKDESVAGRDSLERDGWDTPDAGAVRTAAETSGHEPGVNTHGLRLMKQARVTDANTHTHTHTPSKPMDPDVEEV